MTEHYQRDEYSQERPDDIEDRIRELTTDELNQIRQRKIRERDLILDSTSELEGICHTIGLIDIELARRERNGGL